MSFKAAASGFVVLLLFVSVIQGQNVWGVTYTSTEICALKGTTVEIRCSYRYPSRINGRATTVEKTFWFTKMNGPVPVDLTTDPQYSGRVQDHCENNNCTLKIKDLRESDSAEYKFMFITNQPGGSSTGSPGVTLSVTDLKVNFNFGSSSPVLCRSSCHLPGNYSYIWYKNGQKIPEETSYSYQGSVDLSYSYSCAVGGYEVFPAPSDCQWQNPSQPEDLSKDSQFAGRVQVIDTERGRSTLRITDLRESDSAEYHFKFTSPSFEWRSSLPGTTLTVTELKLLH
uniref:sialic acid-binding Ig-like lectin 12 n=1 Tax=Epinephelus lanceolatus TaxID=310571 RepID=UPI0014463658|nr:sialic acid-binding Ig-like lectin 12 [Epinephelus lanceolatus]